MFNGDTLRLANELKQEELVHRRTSIAKERNQHRLNSHKQGFLLLENSYRRYRSQQIYLAFAHWYQKHCNRPMGASPPNTTRRKQEILNTVSETQQIAAQSAADLQVAQKATALEIQNKESNAAAEAAANPVNALQVLQERLAMLFSDGFKRQERLRRLQNLIQAASRGDADRVSELLDDTSGGKVDLNSSETDAGLCCLVVATINGSLNVVKSCCKRGANLELTDEFGNTPLMIAAKQKAITLCRVLLAHGANVNAENNKNDTALHLVVRLADACPEKLLWLLLEHGANCEWPDSTLNTPLHIASVSKDRYTVLEYMLTSIKRRYCNDDGREAKSGVENKSKKQCRHHLEAVLSACVTQRGATPLMTAARYGHVSSIRLMLQSCYDMEEDDEEEWKDGEEEWEDEEDEEEEWGNDEGKKGGEGKEDGEGKEEEQARRKEEEQNRVKVLLNATDIYGETAIVAAAMRGETEMVKWMLKYGADTTCVTDTGDTLYSLAMMFEHVEIVNLLERGGWKAESKERTELRQIMG